MHYRAFTARRRVCVVVVMDFGGVFAAFSSLFGCVFFISCVCLQSTAAARHEHDHVRAVSEATRVEAEAYEASLLQSQGTRGPYNRIVRPMNLARASLCPIVNVYIVCVSFARFSAWYFSTTDGALKPTYQSLSETKRAFCAFLERGIAPGGQPQSDAAAAYPSAIKKYVQNCKEKMGGFGKPGSPCAVHLEAALFVQLVEVCLVIV